MSEPRKINLFIDAHCFDKEHQGTRAFIKRLYVEFSLLAPQYKLHFGAKDTDHLREELKDIKDCVFIKYRFGDTLRRLSFEIPLIIRKYGISIAHFQYICPFIKNCRQIVTTHDVLFKEYVNDFSWFYRTSRSVLFKYSIRKADVVTTVSEYSKTSIQHFFNLPADRIFVVPNSVGHQFRNTYDKQKSKEYITTLFKTRPSYILCVSRFEPRKSHLSLLKSYLDLKLFEKGYDLVLLGHVSIHVEDFDKLMKNLPIAIRSHIFIHHTIDDENLMHFYKGADIFVFPSKAEGFGLPPIEAGALNIPVICSNSTAMSDFSFFSEYHFDTSNYALLCEKLSKMISSPPDAAFLKSVSEKIMDLYSTTNMANAFIRAIEHGEQH